MLGHGNAPHREPTGSSVDAPSTRSVCQTPAAGPAPTTAGATSAPPSALARAQRPDPERTVIILTVGAGRYKRTVPISSAAGVSAATEVVADAAGPAETLVEKP